MAQKEIIDRDTYKKIKKMDRETLTKFILQYGDELLGEQGKTIVLITHSPELAEETQRIMTLHDGMIVSEREGTGRVAAG